MCDYDKERRRECEIMIMMMIRGKRKKKKGNQYYFGGGWVRPKEFTLAEGANGDKSNEEVSPANIEISCNNRVV